MKKKISLFVCIILCCFSFAFVGCSALDENDKAIINGFYEKMEEFVDNEAQTNADLLAKLDEEQQSNSELLNKIDELTDEVSKLNEKKEYSQEEIKQLLTEKLIYVMINTENYIITNTHISYMNGKKLNEEININGYAYNEDTDTFKYMAINDYFGEVSGEYLEEIFNSETGVYDKKIYDITTGQESNTDPEILNPYNKFLLFGLCENLFQSTISSESAIVGNFSISILDEEKVEFEYSTVMYETVESGIATSIKIVFQGNKLISTKQTQSGIINMDSLDQTTNMTISSVMDIEYIEDFDIEDYILSV